MGGSCVSHFNVSLIVWAKSQDSVHKPQFLKRKESRSGSKRRPSAYQPSALPLGHTESRLYSCGSLYLDRVRSTPSKMSVRSCPRADLHVAGMLRFMSLTQASKACSLLFYFVLVSVSVCMALSTVFHSINSPDNSPLSHSVLPVLFLPYWSFQLYVSVKVSASPDVFLCG